MEDPPVNETNAAAATSGVTARPPRALNLRLARTAACLYFLADGMIFGTWATLIPSFKSRFGLTEADLSLALLGMVVGAIISMPVAGQMISRHGSKPNLLFLAPGFCVTLLLLVLAPSFLALVAAATLFGAFKGAFDVTINSQGIAIENAVNKPIIATFQALWSIGGLVAALLVGIALKNGVGPLAIGTTVAILLCVLVTGTGRFLLAGDASRTQQKSSRFELPKGNLLRIGILAAMALFAEGVMMDWSAVYSRTVSGAEPWLAPLAYGVFSCCMGIGRLSGDFLIGRFGPASILRASGILTTIGLVVIVGVHWWPATFLGLAFAGFGIANLVPILFGAGGRAHEGGVGKGIATVSMMGYFGFLVGPPLIGGVSHWIGLPGAFAIVVLFSAFIAFGGNRLLGTSLEPVSK